MIQKKKQIEGELIYGVHPLLEVLKAKRRKVISIYTTRPEPKAWNQIKQLWPKYQIPIQYVEREVLTRMVSSTDHQGIVAWVQLFPFRKQFFDVQKQAFLVMLDGIQDTRNVGAIIRSAYCTGAQGIIMIRKDAAPLNAAAIKASAGLAEHMEIFIASSAQAAVQELKKAGYTVYLATFDGQDATKTTFKEPLCMVIGSEGIGVSREILKEGNKVTLPQKMQGISYNASVAAGILLFLAATQNKKI